MSLSTSSTSVADSGTAVPPKCPSVPSMLTSAPIAFGLVARNPAISIAPESSRNPAEQRPLLNSMAGGEFPTPNPGPGVSADPASTTLA